MFMLQQGKLKWLAIFILSVFSPFSFGITGVITDPGFSSSKREQRSSESLLGPMQGSFRVRLSRNLLRSTEKFWSSSQKDGLFDTLSVKSDFSLSYPLSEKISFLKSSSLFSELDLFFIISYIRPVYANFKQIRRYCFKSYLCFGDMSFGVSNPLSLKESHIKGQYSIYFNLPYLSKSFFNQKQIFAMGSALDVAYPLVSKEKVFQWSGISAHILDIRAYGSKWGDSQGTFYNEFLSLFNQLGLRFKYSKNSFIPVGLVYGSHRYSLNLNGISFQRLSFGFSSVWSVGEAFRIVFGLDWSDEIYKPAGKVKTGLFDPSGTFINGGLSYSF